MSQLSTFPYTQRDAAALALLQDIEGGIRQNDLSRPSHEIYRDRFIGLEHNITSNVADADSVACLTFDIYQFIAPWAPYFEIQRCQAMQSLQRALEEVRGLLATSIYLRVSYSAGHVATPLTRGSDPNLQDMVTADTDRAMTLELAVKAWNALTRPTEIEEVEVSFDPDDIPLI